MNPSRKGAYRLFISPRAPERKAKAASRTFPTAFAVTMGVMAGFLLAVNTTSVKSTLWSAAIVVGLALAITVYGYVLPRRARNWLVANRYAAALPATDPGCAFYDEQLARIKEVPEQYQWLRIQLYLAMVDLEHLANMLCDAQPDEQEYRRRLQQEIDNVQQTVREHVDRYSPDNLDQETA